MTTTWLDLTWANRTKPWNDDQFQSGSLKTLVIFSERSKIEYINLTFTFVSLSSFHRDENSCLLHTSHSSVHHVAAIALQLTPSNFLKPLRTRFLILLVLVYERRQERIWISSFCFYPCYYSTLQPAYIVHQYCFSDKRSIFARFF